MITDAATDTVFISDLFSHRHSAVVHALKAVLGDWLGILHGTKDIWCRDFMPIQVTQDRFVQFRYDPDYLKDYPHLRTDDGASLLDLTNNCVRSDVVIDGGNVVRWNNTVILTEKIYRENRSVERTKVRDELRLLLEIEHLVVIPKEPEDTIGHSDGMVRFVDDKTVLVNDYGTVDPGFGKRLAALLRKDGFETIPFPYCPTDKPGPDPDIWPAIGVYINFLQVNGMIFCPTFGRVEDDEAMSILSGCFVGDQIIPVRCNELAAEGGVLNCITWNIKRKAGHNAVEVHRH